MKLYPTTPGQTSPCRTCATLLVMLFLASPAIVNPALANDLVEASVPRLQQYLRIDTTNPPGNESRGVAYLAGLLDAAGIPYETAESAPGRGNIWARLDGGSKPALVLLHHIDVVPADADYWEVPPLSGEIRHGYIYGRGAIDTKGLGIVQLQAFIALAKSGRKLSRDVLYVATADEEAGGFFGAGWLLKAHPEVFDKVGYLVNEGGSGTLLKPSGSGNTAPGEVAMFNIEVTQKVPLWLRLTATDIPGHGSAPRHTSAVTRILRAGNRIADTHFERTLVPAVRDYFHAIAPFLDGEHAELMADMNSTINNEAFMHSLKVEEPWRAALLSNTCSLTTLKGSSKINVIPPSAMLELDCRLLPGEDPEAFVTRLEHVIGDPKIAITRIMSFTPAESSRDTPLFASIERALSLSFENVMLVPGVSTGFTDSHFFRDVGIVSYGFAPFLYLSGERTGVHGNNERISITNLKRGTIVMRDFLFDFTSKAN